MKKLIALLALVISTNAFAQDATEDKFDLKNTDKQLHALASYGLTYTTIDAFRRANFSKTQSYMYGSLLTLAIGALKEATDKTGFSTNDMLANSVGVILGIGINFTFDGLISGNKSGVTVTPLEKTVRPVPTN